LLVDVLVDADIADAFDIAWRRTEPKPIQDVHDGFAVRTSCGCRLRRSHRPGDSDECRNQHGGRRNASVHEKSFPSAAVSGRLQL
jgi:hypothetical protein